MNQEAQDFASDGGRPESNTKRSWFRKNSSGIGWRPQSWQGWLILLGAIAAIVVIVVLLRTGVI